jgi:hypothetical protein
LPALPVRGWPVGGSDVSAVCVCGWGGMEWLCTLVASQPAVPFMCDLHVHNERVTSDGDLPAIVTPCCCWHAAAAATHCWPQTCSVNTFQLAFSLTLTFALPPSLLPSFDTPAGPHAAGGGRPVSAGRPPHVPVPGPAVSAQAGGGGCHSGGEAGRHTQLWAVGGGLDGWLCGNWCCLALCAWWMAMLCAGS